MTSKEWKELKYGMALIGFGFGSGAFITGGLFRLIGLGAITITERNMVWTFMAGSALGMIVMLLSCAYACAFVGRTQSEAERQDEGV